MMMLTSLSSFSISLFRWSAIGSPPAGEETQPPIVEERAEMECGNPRRRYPRELWETGNWRPRKGWAADIDIGASDSMGSGEMMMK